MGKDRPRGARYRRLQSRAKPLCFRGFFAARGSDTLNKPIARTTIPTEATKEFVVAKKTKSSKKKRAGKASAAASKKRAGKAVAKKAKRATRKAKKATKKSAAKKTAKKAAKKAKARKSSSAPKTASAAAPSKPPAAPVAPRPAAPKNKPVTSAKPAAAAAPKPAASRGNMYYITTAIAYPNGQPHIGHAYEAIATDALARFQKLDGKDVFCLTGTDEHGQKMIQTAASEGMTAAQLADRNAARFMEMDRVLNVSFDRFIRTTEPAH